MLSMNKYKERLEELKELCFNHRINRAIEFEEQGMKACYSCPLFENGMCDKIFNDDKKLSVKIIEEGIVLMGGIVLDNAWDIVRGMTEEEYEDFKEFLYDKYASMCSISDLISEFSNDELIEKYKEFKGI